MRKIGLITILIVIALSGCAKKKVTNKKTIFVSILPQKFFVEQITGDLWQVETLVKPGFSPALYEPTPQQLQNLQNSKVFFTIGVPYENNFLESAQELLKETKVVSTDTGIHRLPMQNFEEIMMEMEDHHDQEHHEEGHHAHTDVEHHEHDHDHDHDHGGLDPHIWLSPKLVRVQLKTILNTLLELDYANKETYQRSFNDLLIRLNEVESEINSNLKQLKVRSFAVFHPSWGYFARDFNLNQIPIEISGKTPNSKETAEIIRLLRERDIKVIFVQKQFDTSVAKSIASEINGKVIAIDPLAYDYLSNLRKISGIFKEILNQ